MSDRRAAPGRRRGRRTHRPRLALALGPVLLLSACAVPPAPCAVPGQWTAPASLGRVPDPTLGPGHAVILLGETHDSDAAHAWQLAVIRRLYAGDTSLVLGFEMFPRVAQPVLDEWVAGRLSEIDFLAKTDWRHIWGFPQDLYLPIFRFARDHRIPMRALNVSSHLVHLVAQQGFSAVPASQREGVGTPAPPSAAYRAELTEIMSGHGGPAMTPQRLSHFIDAQTLWDRAMAEAIATQRAQAPQRPMAALMGAGHLENRAGVPHQLAALGIPDALVLIPVKSACGALPTGYADAVYVTGPDAPTPAPPQS